MKMEVKGLGVAWITEDMILAISGDTVFKTVFPCIWKQFKTYMGLISVVPHEPRACYLLPVSTPRTLILCIAQKSII